MTTFTEKYTGGQKTAYSLGGHRFGRLSVIERSGRTKSGFALWMCVCDCGNTTFVAANNLVSGNTRSCGCLNKEATGEAQRKRWSAKTLIGMRFGSLTVMEEIGRKSNGVRRWACVCDCGREFLTSTSRLREHSHCGCKNRTKKEPGYRRSLIERFGGVKGALLSVVREYKRGAKLRGLQFDFTEKQVLELLSAPCIYCGVEPSRIRKTGSSEMRWNGIDRVDNSLGYTTSNCVPSCAQCNRAKGNTGARDFLDWIGRVARHQNLLS